MTQEFHLSVTPIRDHDYLVRTEHVAPGVPLAEEQVTWYVDDWLTEASLLMSDPMLGLLRGNGLPNGVSDRALNRSTSKAPSANLVGFGQRLFNALFQGTIRDSWMMAQGIAQHQHHRLRFRLGLKGAQLHRLPWEVLYAGDRPLATGTDVIFSRFHSSFSVLSHRTLPKQPVADSNQSLKILLVLAAPNDQDRLALKQEAEQLRQELQTAIDPGNGNQFSKIELTILDQPGREALTQALEHNHFQVLHYAGHSDLSAAGGSLYLVNSRTGLTEVMSGEDLAGLLVNNGIRMAVFNSCRGVYTATGTGQANDGNLAESLVRRGIPAVLAMAEQIPDNVALNLSRLFYRNLRQAYPLDLSLSRTRQGLISSYGSDRLYWALPILYLHPEFDGFLQPSNQAPVTSAQNYPDFYVSSDLLSFAPEDAIAPPAFPPQPWQAEYPEVPEAPGRSQPTDYLPDFDALEFDDPDPPEEEQVASLVYELSHSPTLLEPEETASTVPAEKRVPFPPTAIAANQATVSQNTTIHTGTPLTPPSPLGTGDTQVYSELEAVLADMGTLTTAIASSNRAVQANPNSAEAYTDLGWALYQQGYLTEAISAYNQAIRLNPSYANAFNRLGLAFFQQGKVDNAVRAYNQAVKLDPTLTEASTNLRDALYGQDHQQQEPPQSKPAAIAPSPAAVPPLPASPGSANPQRWWLWGSLGAIALLAALAGWFYRENLTKFFAPPSGASSSLPATGTPGVDTLLQSFDPASLSTLASEQLRQGKLSEAQATIEALLSKPNGFQHAGQVLQGVPAEVENQPAIAFLKGRLIWQQWLAGDKSASVEAARQLWDKSTQTEPTPQTQNALGFAYYTQGKVDRAEQAWMTSLRLAGGTASPNGQLPASDPPLKSAMLTAYAGLAMTAFKLSEQQPLNQQATLRDEAMKRRQVVEQGDRDAFRPEALRQNWMWSELAIQDWEKVLKL